jgi:hypothetical protein
MLADFQGEAIVEMIVLRTRMLREMRRLLTDTQRAKRHDPRERKLTPES